jgi:hypothetical protein
VQVTKMNDLPLMKFEANLPHLTEAVLITSFHDAKVFARRWVIRDKDRDLKSLLRRMEKANSWDSAQVAVRELKQALESRGLLPAALAPV